MHDSKENFGLLGTSYQQSLIKTIIEDKKYGETIIDIIESRFFENNSFKFIMENLKELYLKYKEIPNYVTLEQKIKSEYTNLDNCYVHIDTLKSIKETEISGQFQKDEALKFCKQQNLKKEIKTIQKIIENGRFEEYDKIEELIKKALQVGSIHQEPEDVFNEAKSILERKNRRPIPTGIVGIDNLLNGGLSKGELGIVLAPTGVGKTTALTKIANTAFNNGFNVLQVFFEDNEQDIKTKHYTIWSGEDPDNFKAKEDEVFAKIEEIRKNARSTLKLSKQISDDTTITSLKNYIRKYISDGNKLDLLIIDYVDCIKPERSPSGEEWKGEGSIMRSLESMTSEFDIAIWTATQGNRESISSDIVNSDQMGGSIKKAQIAHVIISIARSFEQKEHNLATLTLVKSRIGRDGVIFSNCKFNNKMLEISTENEMTFLGHQQEQQRDQTRRVREAFNRGQEV
jgi:replicative DNA helicase